MNSDLHKHSRRNVTGSSSLVDAELAGRRGLDYRRLRELVSLTMVLELLGWEPVSKYGPQLRGPCPVHRSENPRSRTFSANTAKNVFHCFKPDCSAQGNQLDLYVAVTGLPLFGAALELCDKLGIEPPWREPTK